MAARRQLGVASRPHRSASALALVLALLVVLLDAPHAGAVTVPVPLPPGSPGQVIQTEDLGPVPGGTRYRILYHSRSVGGDDIAVSGLVFVPSTPAPVGGRPVVAWAHGTTGIADICAPSLGGYDPEYLTELLAAGYVVTATDYEGLGTPGRHPYLVGESEGRGVLDSIRAALVMPEANAANRAVIFGHSQGGHATIFTNELAPTYAPELHVLGAVAVAPASQLLAAWSIATSGPVVRAAVVMMGAGFAQSYPSLDLAAVYTPLAISRMGVVDTGCAPEVNDAYADLTQDQIVHTLPDQVPSWKAAIDASEPGFRVGAGPVLLLHGTADEEVPYEASVSLSQRMCTTGQAHHFSTYADQTHSGIFGPAHDEILSWIGDRFADRAAVNDCTGGPAPVTPGPGECGAVGTVTANGLPVISDPVVAEIRDQPTALGSPFALTTTPSILPGGTIDVTGTTSAELRDAAQRLLDERVRPIITAQYGAGLAKTAWVQLQLDDVRAVLPLPPGTELVGAPTVTGSDPTVSVTAGPDGLVLTSPTFTVDSRQPVTSSTAVHGQLRDLGTAPPATISFRGGPVSVRVTVTIGVLFFGAPLTGGATAEFSCLPPAEPLAQTAVVADAAATTTTTSTAPAAVPPSAVATPVTGAPSLAG